MTKTLTPKQEDFLEALLGEAHGNIRAGWTWLDILKVQKPLRLLALLKKKLQKEPV